MRDECDNATSTEDRANPANDSEAFSFLLIPFFPAAIPTSASRAPRTYTCAPTRGTYSEKRIAPQS